MFELPYPNLLTKTNEERIDELVRYLIQFREDLEFILANIGVDNLSDDLQKKLTSLGFVGNEEASRVLSVQDVVESPMFAQAVRNIISKS